MSSFQPRDPASFGFQEVVYRKEGWVATVAFNRPHVYNAYSPTTLREMAAALRDASRDDRVAVVVLTGVGEKAFCTGGDVKEYAANYTVRPRDYWKWMGDYVACLDALRNVGKPTIARLNGVTAGGGNEFNLACDLAVIAQHARILQVGTRVGSVAAGGATQWLPLVIGDRRAREMLYLCEDVHPYQALEWGLVNRVAPSVRGADGAYLDLRTPEEVKAALADPANRVDLTALDEAVAELAEKLVHKFPESLRYTKEQLNFWGNLSWGLTIGHARDWLALHYTSLETHEGMQAFVDKRPADYLGVRERAASGGSSEYLWGPNVQDCPQCGATRLPGAFSHCGVCGAALKGVAQEAAPQEAGRTG